MKFLEIAFTCYSVTDLARSRDFYEKILGLKPALNFEKDGKGWFEYEIGSGTLAITNMDPEGWPPAEFGAAVALEVVDFDAAIAELKAAKVKFSTEPVDYPSCRMAMICDPDGSKLCIHQRKAK